LREKLIKKAQPRRETRGTSNGTSSSKVRVNGRKVIFLRGKDPVRIRLGLEQKINDGGEKGRMFRRSKIHKGKMEPCKRAFPKA